jgi:hypothetical protein
MMQLARQFSRLFTKQPCDPQAMDALDVRESFRTERAGITRPDTIPVDFSGASGAGWSDTLALLSQWNDEALAADFDDSFASDHKCNSLNL